jgi:cytochrome P450
MGRCCPCVLSCQCRSANIAVAGTSGSGPPADDDESLGAQLLRIRDADGKPLPDEQLLPHIGILFAAGMDTTGHAMAWSL